MNSNKEKTDFMEMLATMCKRKYPDVEVVIVTIESGLPRSELAVVSTLQQEEMIRLLQQLILETKGTMQPPKTYDA